MPFPILEKQHNGYLITRSSLMPIDASYYKKGLSMDF